MRLRACVRGISGRPTMSCISGVTGRGFMIPRGTLLLVAAGSEDAVADVMARTKRSLATGWEASRRDKGGVDEMRNDDVLMQRKVEHVPEETAIIGACLCGGFGKTKGVLCYPLILGFLSFSGFVFNRGETLFSPHFKMKKLLKETLGFVKKIKINK